MEEATLRKWGRFYFLIVFYFFYSEKIEPSPKPMENKKLESI